MQQTSVDLSPHRHPSSRTSAPIHEAVPALPGHRLLPQVPEPHEAQLVSVWKVTEMGTMQMGPFGEAVRDSGDRRVDEQEGTGEGKKGPEAETARTLAGSPAARTPRPLRL